MSMNTLSTRTIRKGSRTIPGILAGAGLLAAITAPVPAQAALFNWTFSNVVGSVSGTVSGTLEVPEGMGVSATSVVLTATTNPVFDGLVGLDFLSLDTFSNSFNVAGGAILAASFANDWFQAGTHPNISLELNSGVFGDVDSQNLGLLTLAGNPLPVGIGGDDACNIGGCLQTATIFGDNAGQTQFAPRFEAVPAPATLALILIGLAGLRRRA